MENSAKILLLGKSGVGKSAFINYFLGKTVAKSAAGKPVTQDYFIPYEIEGGRYPVEIFDTKGLEAIGAYEQLNEIIEGIKQKNNDDNVFNWFHTIFYCVSMTTHFEDFEANFIRRLQQELTQHVHIILTHCDSVLPETVANMRSYIAEKLGSTENIEIFEVVCVSKKKRNGTVVEPYGREKISERVFDLLLGDISHKLSSDYANTLWYALKNVVDSAFNDLNDFIDETIKIKTLFRIIKDTDYNFERIDTRMNEVLTQIGEKMETVEKQTGERFEEILRPAAQLYNSYWGVATGSDVVNAELAFLSVFEWIDDAWIEEIYEIPENDCIKYLLPKMGQYMDENCEIPDDNSLSEALGMIIAGVSDLFSLKKTLKSALKEARWKLIYESIPSRNEIQANAYKRIVKLIKPDIQPENDETQTDGEALVIR